VVGKGDQAVRTKWVGVMTVAAAGSQKHTTNFAKAALLLAAVIRSVFAHG
jgi:hypothetical protein